jgi:CheY-like chemotaxis protein
VVGDEWLIPEDIAACLRASGHQVVGPAPSGAAAIRLIGENHVDGALLDIQLNGETAWRSQKNCKPATRSRV